MNNEDIEKLAVSIMDILPDPECSFLTGHNQEIESILREFVSQALEEAAQINDELALEAAADSEWNAKTDLERAASRIRVLKDSLVAEKVPS